MYSRKEFSRVSFPLVTKLTDFGDSQDILSQDTFIYNYNLSLYILGDS